ncbi:MAG: ribosomal biogenesis protein [Candidatus Thermoplasmatota archaeon]
MSDSDKILHTTWFGSFIIEDGEVIDKELFPKKPEEIAKRKSKMEEGEVLEEEKRLINRLEAEPSIPVERLSEFGDVKDIEEIEIDPDNYSYDDALLQKSLQELGRRKIRESIDFGEHLARAVETIQDLNETINMKLERLKTWYSLYFSELEDEVNDEKYLELIIEEGDREDIKKKIGFEEEFTGQEVTDQEINHFRKLARSIKDEIEFREELEDYVESKMQEYAPNLSALTGPKLGGELIAKQGSLESLAKQPSSTIQVLGAEKSLFRHLDKGTDPPKHGLILQHPYVHRAPESLRGKIARTFANKIAIAARIDYFGGEYRGEKMREELEEKIEQIKKEN